MTMTRNEFLRSVIGVGIGAAAAATLVGCGGDDGGSSGDDGGDDAPAECTSPSTSVSANHGHMITVPLADVEAATEKTYTLTTGNGHTHDITISATQFGQIMNGQTLMITTTTDGGHSHSVTIQCVS